MRKCESRALKRTGQYYKGVPDLVLDGEKVPTNPNPGWGCDELKQTVEEIQNSIEGPKRDIYFHRYDRDYNDPDVEKKHWDRINRESDYLRNLKDRRDYVCRDEERSLSPRPKPPVTGNPGNSIKLPVPKEEIQIDNRPILPMPKDHETFPRPRKPTPDALWIVDTITGKGYWRY